MRITITSLFALVCTLIAQSTDPGIGIGSITADHYSSELTITFSLEGSSFVTLGLIDRSGGAVSLITDGFYQAGNHNAIFNTDEIPTGLYMIRLDALGQSVFRRCVVLE